MLYLKNNNELTKHVDTLPEALQDPGAEPGISIRKNPHILCGFFLAP